MRFLQNDKKNYGISFKAKKSTHQWTKFFVEIQKALFFWYIQAFLRHRVFSKKSGSFLTFRHIVSHSLMASRIFLIFYHLHQSGLDFPQKFY